jgi:hypothetical protein
MPYALNKQTECYPKNTEFVSSKTFPESAEGRGVEEGTSARASLNSRQLAEECLTPRGGRVPVGCVWCSM